MNKTVDASPLAAKRQPYERPVLKSHGSVSELTKGGQSGGFLDADFPAGTPFGDLTFS